MDLSGSQVVAGTGDILISGQNVTIDSHFDTNDYKERQWTKESGLTISVGLNGAVGQAVSQAVVLAEQAKAAKEARSDRAAALYGIAATRSAYDLGNQVAGLLNPTPPSGHFSGRREQRQPGGGVGKRQLRQQQDREQIRTWLITIISRV